MTTAVELLLVRHASSDQPGRFLGHSDVGLGPTAAAELAELALILRGLSLDAVVSSDLRRCRATAARLLPGHAVRCDAAWREYDSGAWTMASHAELIAGPDTARYQAWLDDPDGQRPPGGEGMADFRRRVTAAADDLARAHPGGRVLVISHAGPIRLLAVAAGATAPAATELPPASLHRCRWPPGCRSVKEGVV